MNCLNPDEILVVSRAAEGTDEIKISSGVSWSRMGDKIFVIVQYIQYIFNNNYDKRPLQPPPCSGFRMEREEREEIVAATAVPGLEERGGKVWVLLLLLPCPT